MAAAAEDSRRRTWASVTGGPGAERHTFARTRLRPSSPGAPFSALRLGKLRAGTEAYLSPICIPDASPATGS